MARPRSAGRSAGARRRDNGFRPPRAGDASTPRRRAMSWFRSTRTRLAPARCRSSTRAVSPRVAKRERRRGHRSALRDRVRADPDRRQRRPSSRAPPAGAIAAIAIAIARALGAAMPEAGLPGKRPRRSADEIARDLVGASGPRARHRRPRRFHLKSTRFVIGSMRNSRRRSTISKPTATTPPRSLADLVARSRGRERSTRFLSSAAIPPTTRRPALGFVRGGRQGEDSRRIWVAISTRPRRTANGTLPTTHGLEGWSDLRGPGRDGEPRATADLAALRYALGFTNFSRCSTASVASGTRSGARNLDRAQRAGECSKPGGGAPCNDGVIAGTARRRDFQVFTGPPELQPTAPRATPLTLVLAPGSLPLRRLVRQQRLAAGTAQPADQGGLGKFDRHFARRRRRARRPSTAMSSICPPAAAR